MAPLEDAGCSTPSRGAGGSSAALRSGSPTRAAARQHRPQRPALLLSCGPALHHARTALASAGWSATVERLPDPPRPDQLARIRLGAPVPADPEAVRMAAAIARRRTDRRAFGDRPVPEAELTKLRRFAEAEGAYLHVVRPDQIPALAVSTELAAGAELDDLLTSGEAPSALLLLTTADGLATAPLSDAIEVEWPHQLLRGLLAGIGEPHLVIRPDPTSFVLRHVTSGNGPIPYATGRPTRLPGLAGPDVPSAVTAAWETGEGRLP